MTVTRIVITAILIASVISISLMQENAYAITVTPTDDPDDIKNALLAGGGGGIDPSSVIITIEGHSTTSGVSTGIYVNNSSGTYGIGDGIIISSGDVADYGDGPNNDPDHTTAYGVQLQQIKRLY